MHRKSSNLLEWDYFTLFSIAKLERNWMFKDYKLHCTKKNVPEIVDTATIIRFTPSKTIELGYL